MSATVTEEIRLERLDPASRNTSAPASSLGHGGGDEDGQGAVAGIDGSREQLVSDLAPIDGGRKAWTFVFASFVFETMIWGQSYAYGAYQNYHDHDVRSALYGKASPAATSAIGTLVIAGQHFVPLLTRGFFRTYPHLIKRVALGSIALSSLSLLAASFLEAHVAALLVFQGILYGILSGVTFTPVILWLPQWFDERRGTASGIIYSGSGLGGTVFPLLVGKLLDGVGFAWTLRIVALVSFIATSLAAMLMQPRLPIVTAPSWPRQTVVRRLLPEGIKAMWSTPFAGVGEAIIFCQSCAWCTISLYISTYTSSLGFNATTATGILSAFNASATVGYLSIGRLIDMTSYPFVMGASTLTCSLAAFLLLGFSHSLPLLVAFVLVFGLAGGGFTTFLTPLSTDLAKLNGQDLGTIYLALIFVRGTAAVGGPLVGAALYDEGELGDFALYGAHGFRDVIIFVGTGMIIACGLAIAAWLLRRKWMAAST